MSAAQHTPGPWEQKIQSCGFWSICTVYGTEQGWIEIHAPNGGDTEDCRAESTANARLICAAPELLEALQTALQAFSEMHHARTRPDWFTKGCAAAIQHEIMWSKRGIETVLAAIAKATGETA